MSNSACEAINARIRALRIEQEQISASYDAQIKGLAESLDILDRHLQSTATAITDSPVAPLPTPTPKKRRGRRTKAEMAAAAAAKSDGANKPPSEDYADI